MKKSIYNVNIDTLEDGRILIYNTFSGIYGIMDEKTQRLYENIENVNLNDITDEEDKKNIQTMLKSGYIVDKEKDELATVKLNKVSALSSTHMLSLTIAPTMGCNMRCPYCYENKNGKVMSEEIRKKVIDFVKMQINLNKNLNRVSVTWYGGEPLLKKDIIYELSENFIKLCDENNVTYDASIVTNGVLLDEETAKNLFYKYRVKNAQITIDGMPDEHNSRRILADGTGSFDVIVKNIDKCKEFLPMTIRVNVDKFNTYDVTPLANFLLEEKGWTTNPRVYLAPVQNYTDYCKQDSSVCIPSQEFAEINNEFLKYYYSVSRENVARKFFPSRKDISCGAECINNHVIDPDGYFYKCWLVIGNEKYRTGHVSKPYLINQECYKWLSFDIPEKCEKCNYLPMCVGGCSYFRRINNGEPKCNNTYYNYKETLKLAYYDYMQQNKKSE